MSVRIFFYLSFLLLISINNLYGQSLQGKRIALDPGHGSPHGTTCEPETKRFETYVNHIVVPYLKQYLQNDGAIVITTRADYDSLGPCMTLSERVAIANNNNAHFFNSVHHNAFDGNANYSLVLYRQLNTNNCPNGNPQTPEAYQMSFIMAPRLHEALYTTSGIVRGDLCFLGFNLGVLRNLTMPGTLSEASFFDNVVERRRLSNLDYLRTEAEALYHSFLEFYNAPFPSHGSLVGVVTNTHTNSPANGVKVIIESLGLEYQVDNRGNGFYRFDTLAPGSYEVKVVTPIDTSVTTAIVQGGKINKRNLNITLTEIVGDLKLNVVLSTQSGINVLWSKPAGTVDFYDIYLSEDGINWSNEPYRSVSGNLTGNAISGLETGNTYYVRMKARNSISTSPNFTKVYGAYLSSSSEKTLIVDGFNRYGGTGSWQSPSHNFTTQYGSALAQHGLRFESVSNTIITQPSQLMGYKNVIWFLGDESITNKTFTTSEQEIIIEYLKSGGNLFVTGSEIGFDLDQTGSQSDKYFYNNYLKAKYIAKNPTPNIPEAFGLDNTLFAGLDITFGEVYPEDLPDVIESFNESYEVMKYNETETAGIAYNGIFPDGTKEGNLVYLAFAVETMENDSLRNELIGSVMDFFGALTSVPSEKNFIPVGFELSAYPNPFNPAVTINFTAPSSDIYKISVYNMLGQKLFDVYTGELTAGEHRFTLDMSEYSSGTYIVNIYSSNYFNSLKLLMMK